MCYKRLYSQCETTQVKEHGKGASLFGYTKLYGEVPGGQAEYLRVPQAHFGPIKVPEGPPDDRFVYLSDVLPTAWQAVEYAAVPEGGSVAGSRRRDRCGAARWNAVGVRRLRRRARTAADDGSVRQADPGPHGSGERQAVDRGHPAARHSGQRPARN